MRALLLVTVFAVAVPDRQDLSPKEAKPNPDTQLLGDWKDDHNNYVLRFAPGETLFIMNGQPSPSDGLTAHVVIDWSKSPVHIDFIPKQRGGKMMGILKLEGDRLTINVRTGGGDRPTMFVGNQDLLLHYNRMRR